MEVMSLCSHHSQGADMVIPNIQRYHRQVILPELGVSGQQKLQNAKVLVMGAGGLGCPALQYLCGAGIGTVGIVDHDIVSLSNLHRQTLYSTDDIGLSKANRAVDILSVLNPEIEILPFNQFLNSENAIDLIAQFDFILDGTDNFATKYMVNDACVLLNKTLVYGAISRFEGQLAVFNHQAADEIPTNYRDLFPNPPGEDEILNCEEAGVIGVLPGIIGTMMANETIKLITGIGKPLINKVLTYNSLNNQIYTIDLLARTETRSLIPVNIIEFQKRNYQWLCSNTDEYQIDLDFFKTLLNNPKASFIDLREADEMPEINEIDCLRLPMSVFKNNLDKISSEVVVLICQSGKRSLGASKIVSEYYGKSKKIYSLKGGVIAWKHLNEI